MFGTEMYITFTLKQNIYLQKNVNLTSKLFGDNIQLVVICPLLTGKKARYKNLLFMVLLRNLYFYYRAKYPYRHLMYDKQADHFVMIFKKYFK